MECPRLHGELQSVDISRNASDSKLVGHCGVCHAVCMSDLNLHELVGVEYATLSADAFVQPAIDLNCPQCHDGLQCDGRLLETSFDGWRAYVCPRCHQWFLDAGVLTYLLRRNNERLRSSGVNLDEAPAERVFLKCTDCGGEIDAIQDAFSSAIGCSCKKCHDQAPILSETKFQESQLVTFHGMEVKIDRLRNDFRRIMVTPVQPGRLNVSVRSLSIWERIWRLGWRNLALRGDIRHCIDASEGVDRITPWTVFLKQRGVTDCLEALNEIGRFSITFKPHNLIFELEGDLIGAEMQLRFEATVRRLLIAYEKYDLMIREVYRDSGLQGDGEGSESLDQNL